MINFFFLTYMVPISYNSYMQKLEDILINLLSAGLFILLWRHIQDKPDIQNYIVAPCLAVFMALIIVMQKKIYIFVQNKVL